MFCSKNQIIEFPKQKPELYSAIFKQTQQGKPNVSCTQVWNNLTQDKKKVWAQEKQISYKQLTIIEN